MNENQILVADAIIKYFADRKGFVSSDDEAYNKHLALIDPSGSYHIILTYLIVHLGLIAWLEPDPRLVSRTEAPNPWLCLTPLGFYASEVGFSVFLEEAKQSASASFANNVHSALLARQSRRLSGITLGIAGIALIVSAVGLFSK